MEMCSAQEALLASAGMAQPVTGKEEGVGHRPSTDMTGKGEGIGHKPSTDMTALIPTLLCQLKMMWG